MRSLRACPAIGVALALVVAGGGGATARAAPPPGAADTLRAARPADHAARPTSPAEWWTLRALDPRSDAALELRLERRPGETRLFVNSTSAGEAVTRVDGPVRGDARSLSAAGTGVSLAIRSPGEGLTADVAAPEFRGRIALRTPTRGPAALGLDVGRADYVDPGHPLMTLSWSLLVATSSVRGEIDLRGARIDLDGWRATYEHGWGHVYVGEHGWDLWDTYLVHRPAGGAWVAFGLNRWDTVTGPGARDPMWIGMLARVTRRGVRACRPAVRRSRWQWSPYDEPELLVARRLQARCRGLRARFDARDDRGGLGTGFDYAYFEFGRPATVDGAGDGWAHHRGTKLDAGEP